MASLKNFLSKLPLAVIADTEITDTSIKIPTKIDADEFTRQHRPQIETEGLTTEKAIHVASTHRPAEFKTATSMLYGHLVNRK